MRAVLDWDVHEAMKQKEQNEQAALNRALEGLDSLLKEVE